MKAEYQKKWIMGTHGRLADVYTDQRYKLRHSLRAGSLVLDGEPQLRAGEKNEARKSFLASFFSPASLVLQHLHYSVDPPLPK